MSLKQVNLPNGETIAYREREGGEEVVMLVHGNMTSSKHWDLLMDVLDPKYKVYAVDLRGFGGSTYRNRITSIKDFSDDLKGVVDHLGLDEFSLVGWSTGGAVCMQFVIDYPGLCEKVVLLSSASTRGYPMFATKEDGSANLERRLVTIDDIEKDGRTVGMQYLYDSKNRDGLKDVWNAVIYTHHQPDSEKYDEYVEDMLTQRNLADVYHALNTFNISNRHNGVSEGTSGAKQITIPVLNLSGDRDFVVIKQMTDEIDEDLAHTVESVVLKDTGHSALVDNLETLKNEIENFLN